MLFLRMLFFALFLLITASAKLEAEENENVAKVLDSCTKKTHCPDNSFCARRGCDGMICMCNIDYQPSEDFTQCLKVVELYRSCVDENTRCRGPLAFCEHTTKTCRCIDGYIPANDNIRCKKMPRYGLSYAMLDEECEEGVLVCQDSNQQICSSDTLKCTCRDGWKPASSIDLNAEPFILDECRPADFSLDVELKECKKPIIIGLALVGQDCITDNNCPDKSKCKQIGCEKKQCRCVNGTAPTPNMESCKPGVLLHSHCNDSVVCLGAFVACIKGKCRCSHGSVEAINKQCKSKPPIPGHVEFAALGEECNDGKNGNVIKMCESAMCTEGVCRCPPTMRAMTLGEILNNPNKFPTCVAIEALSEELSPAEYELRCITLPNELAELNRTGAKPGVTARWDEEPRASTIYIISEDNVEPAVEEFDENQVIEASAPNNKNSNNTVRLMDILMGNNGNDTISPDDVAERLFSLNESLGTELVNASMGVDLLGDLDVVALNDTFNYLLTNDFDASDYNESYDAEYMPDDLNPFNETTDSDSLNGTMEVLSVNGSLDIDIGNSSLELNSLNSSNGVDSFNSSLDLDISNSTLDLESLALNDSSGVDISNSSLGLDVSNSSLEIEGLLLEDFNSSLSNSSLNEMSLNDSLDFISSNDSDSGIDAGFSNSSSSNETLDTGIDLESFNESLSLNMTADISEEYLEMINESLQMNETADSVDDLLELFDSSLNDSLHLFLENFNQSSLESILDSNAVGENMENITDSDFEFETNDVENGNAFNGSLDVDTVNGSLPELELEDLSSNGTIGEESMNDTLAGGQMENLNGNVNATASKEVIDVSAYLKKVNGNGTEATLGASFPNDTISNEGGMEETLREESPDLGLAISDDGTHFIGSSGEQIEPVNYNNGADKDVDQVDELVVEGNYNNRKLLEKCNAMDVCPPLSQCLEVGCGPPICFCLPTYGPSEDRETCVQGAAQPLHCSDLDTYEEIQPNRSSDDTAPVAVATTLVCLGLILLLAVVIIYLRLNL